MIKSSDLFHIPFYKKSPYTGSLEGMRFYIEKTQENETDVFQVWIFPGPYCFAKTADSLKQSVTFPFTEESLAKIADWLNEQYTKRSAYWNQHKSLL
ncbi:MAG: GNAT family acetyltransferase [Eubacterium sp.]|nr:GNAT family acetyltransferase [Eubacterium sp.]